ATAETVPCAFIVFPSCALAKDGAAAIATATAKIPTRRLIADLLKHSAVPTPRGHIVTRRVSAEVRLLCPRTRSGATETSTPSVAGSDKSLTRIATLIYTTNGPA